jgi:hypothetical protein
MFDFIASKLQRRIPSLGRTRKNPLDGDIYGYSIRGIIWHPSFGTSLATLTSSLKLLFTYFRAIEHRFLHKRKHKNPFG